MEKGKYELLESFDKEKSLQESYSQKLSSELKQLQDKLSDIEGRMNKRESPAMKLDQPALGLFSVKN